MQNLAMPKEKRTPNAVMIRRLSANGFSNAEIADKLKIKVTQIYTVVNKMKRRALEQETTTKRLDKIEESIAYIAAMCRRIVGMKEEALEQRLKELVSGRPPRRRHARKAADQNVPEHMIVGPADNMALPKKAETGI